MGWGKRLRKAVKRIGGKSIMKVVKPVKSFFKGPKDTPEVATSDTGARGEAAARLIKTSTRQAGGGQISYNTEETT
jgi:hypothetical protein